MRYNAIWNRFTGDVVRYTILLFIGVLLASGTVCHASAKQKTNDTVHEPFQESRWIAAGPERPDFDTTYAAPFFRKAFDVAEEVKKATAYVTAGGYFELYLNGEKVGDHVLDPAVTRYDKTVKYVVFDITDYINAGTNAAGGVIGNGFYNVHTESAWDFDEAPWRNRPAFLCEIVVELENGEQIRCSSDASWKFSTGPITFNQLRNGEYYDARLELSGWSEAGYDDSQWQPVTVVQGPAGKLSEQLLPPIKKTKTLNPVSITEPEEGIYLVDFGQNISGWSRIKVNEETGREVKIQYGERIYPDGTLDVRELSRFISTGETQTTRYISNGEQDQIYEPRFTYFGFQYAEISGLSEKPEPDDIQAFMMNTAFDTVGYFESSNDLLNQIHENIQWSYLGNFHSFPEDCPHREKMGWTGDAQLAVEIGLFNFDAASSYRKWLQDFSDEQQPSGDLPGIIPTSGWGYSFGQNQATRPLGYGPHWEGAVVEIPWQVYRYTGDTTFIREFYPVMRKYINHLNSVSENYLLIFGIDDHKSIKTHTEGAYISSAYFHDLTMKLADMAHILGKESESGELTSLAERIFKSFQKQYYHSAEGIYGNGGQTALALALDCGLVPERLYSDVLDKLLNKIEENGYHFDSGVVGVKKVINVLLENERTDVLYKMSIQTDFPSFGNWIQMGANTMWQNWDGSQSRNHIMFGSIGDYFYKGLAGINPVESDPGFKVIALKPQFPDDMDYLKAGHKTSSGWIRTEWKRQGENVLYSLEIPGDTETQLQLTGYAPADESLDFRQIGSGYLASLRPGKYKIVLRKIK